MSNLNVLPVSSASALLRFRFAGCGGSRLMTKSDGGDGNKGFRLFPELASPRLISSGKTPLFRQEVYRRDQGLVKPLPLLPIPMLRHSSPRSTRGSRLLCLRTNGPSGLIGIKGTIALTSRAPRFG